MKVGLKAVATGFVHCENRVEIRDNAVYLFGNAALFWTGSTEPIIERFNSIDSALMFAVKLFHDTQCRVFSIDKEDSISELSIS